MKLAALLALALVGCVAEVETEEAEPVADCVLAVAPGRQEACAERDQGEAWDCGPSVRQPAAGDPDDRPLGDACVYAGRSAPGAPTMWCGTCD